MSSKIIFGSDLIDVLENKYNMNKLSEVPTKYKNGTTIIDFIYGKEKDNGTKSGNAITPTNCHRKLLRRLQRQCFWQRM